MLIPRRFAPLFAGAAFCFFFFFFILLLRSAIRRTTWRDLPQVVGLGEVIPDDYATSGGRPPSDTVGQGLDKAKAQEWKPKSSFPPGIPPGPEHNYTKVVVIPKTKGENTDWLQEMIPGLQTAIYVADDPSAALHPPKNKGNEVMVYLTYIIDRYEDLPDVTLFMHSHRYSWHNNDIMNNDAYEIISRISSERVIREGYMNLRCHWNPGCPDWIHPGRVEVDGDKREEKELARVWSELFPLENIPQVLAQPCCSQFALSRERLRALPRAKYVFYQDWLLRTNLNTYLSGRVWEYLWQYVFTGQNAFCPDQHVCYCDGFGICFENEVEFDYWFELKFKVNDVQKEIDDWNLKAKLIEHAQKGGLLDEAEMLEVPEIGKDVVLNEEHDRILRELDQRRDAAIARGNDPRSRAAIAGREWHEGDWY